MKERDLKKLLDITIVAIGEFVENHKEQIIDKVVAAIHANDANERLTWEYLGLSTRAKNAVSHELNRMRKWGGTWDSQKTARVIVEDEPPTRIECLQLLEHHPFCGGKSAEEVKEKLTEAVKQ